MCSHSVPCSISSIVPVTTCQGVGKITLSVCTTTAHHSAITNATSTEGNTIFCHLPITNPVVHEAHFHLHDRARAPAQARPPRRLRHRRDNDRQLTVQMRGAGE